MRVFLFLTNFSIQLLLNLPQPSDTIKVLLCESLFLSLYIYVSLPKRKTEIFDCLLYDCCVPCLIISPTAYLSIRQYMRLLYVTYQCLFCMYIYLSLYLSLYLCPSISLYQCLSLCTYVYLSIYLYLRLSISLYLPMSIYRSMYISISLLPVYFFISMYQSLQPCVCLYTCYLYIGLFLRQSVRLFVKFQPSASRHHLGRSRVVESYRQQQHQPPLIQQP